MERNQHRDDAGAGAGADPYSRAQYRRLIAWESRIAREGPFLEELLARAPERAVLDIGCGSGEHVAFFAERGARAVGLDRSEAMLADARDHERRGAGRFVLGDATRAREALAGEPPFGLAISLGNMLPHLREDQELDALLAEVRALLVPGGIFLLQILDYERIVSKNVRALPVNVRDGEDGEEIVFLRLMRSAGPERILFFPTTLALDAESEEPVRVVSTRRVELRPWRERDLRPRLERLGFAVTLYGGLCGGLRGGLCGEPYVAGESQDLVIVAERRDCTTSHGRRMRDDVR